MYYYWGRRGRDYIFPIGSTGVDQGEFTTGRVYTCH